MIQFIRGNTAANDNYTGPNGSLSIDTQANNIRLHDGVNAGGVVIANIDQAGAIDTISASSPILISGTTSDPVIEIQQATTSQDGYMSSTDKTNLDTAYGWGDHAAEGYENQSNKGVANGYAGLDGTGKVPSGQIPSYVDSVNGQTGVVSLDSDDISEGTSNLFYTDARARSAISVSGDLTYSGGVISFSETYSDAADIKTAYESNANTNAFTDSDKTKLSGIQAGAEANEVDSVNGQTGAVVIPNADASSAGLVSTGTQTFSGNKTFTGVITIDEGAI